MARKTKYRKDLADKIVELVGQGYCLKDVAYFCGLSDRTISRWRETRLDFNEALVKATQRSAENIEAIKRLGHRTYQRKAYISPNYGQEPLIPPLNRPQRQDTSPKNPTWMGLPIRPRPSPYEVTPPYVNQNNGRVEWIENDSRYGLALHSCSMAIWWKRQRIQYDDMLLEVY